MFKKIVSDVNEFVSVVKFSIMISVFFAMESDFVSNIKKSLKEVWYYISNGCIAILISIPILIILILIAIAGIIVSVFWLFVLGWRWFKGWN